MVRKVSEYHGTVYVKMSREEYEELFEARTERRDQSYIEFLSDLMTIASK